MANWEVLQARFTQGELSPLLLGQADSEIIREGAQRILNGVVLPQGPVTTRPATNYLTDFDALTDNVVRLWSFIGPESKDLFACFFDDKVQVLDWESGTIGGTTGPYTQLIPNNNFTLGLDDWDGSNYNGYYGGILFYVETKGVDQQARLRLTVATNADGVPPAFETPVAQLHRGNILPIDSQDFVLQCNARYQNDDGSTANNPLTGNDLKWYLKLKLGTTSLGSEIGEQVFELELLIDRLYTLNVTTGAAITAGTEVFCTAEFYGVTQEPLPDGSFFEAVVYHDCFVDDIYLNVRPAAVVAPIELTTPYTGTELNDLHFLQSPYNDRDLICLHPDHAPQTLYYDSGLTTWIFDTFTINNPPLVWGATGKWPSIGAGVQGRLALTGLETDPEIIWMSKSEDWNDFDLGAAAPTDGIEFTAQVRDVNTWIISGKGVLYGDRKKEYEITAQQFISPSDIGVSLQNSFGAERNPQKILMGKNVVLATGGNNDVRLLRYSRDDNGFIAPNIVLKSEHLGKKQFKRHFYTRDPNQILWNVMQDGTMTLCSFDDDLNVQAWSRFETNGFILDGCAVNDDQGRNVVVLAIRRTVDSQQVINLETIYPLRDINSWQIVDSAVTVYPSIPAVGLLAGFEKLEGQTVAVFLDGNYDGLQTVTAGEVSVAEAVGQVTVGLPFNFQLKTFPQASYAPDIGLNSRKRFSKVGIRGLFSFPPIINGQRPPDRSTDAVMNLSEPKQSLLDTQVVDDAYDNYAVITIEETLPVRLTVAAIFGKLASNEL